jgi:hypothetical protein
MFVDGKIQGAELGYILYLDSGRAEAASPLSMRPQWQITLAIEGGIRKRQDSF